MRDQAQLDIVIRAQDEASRKLEQVNRSLGLTARQARIAGTAMIAAGGAMVAMLGDAVRAAAQEEASSKRMIVAMRNVGISYDEVGVSLEAWIDAQQQKTSISDTAQRDSLASLLRITRDVTEAQDLLTLAMDVAVGTGRDLESATTLLMYALSGNWGMLERYIPAIKEAADEEGKWMLLRELFEGQAEEFGQTLQGQYELLKNNIGDIKESIGAVLLPVVEDAARAFNWVAQAIKNTDPTLVKVGVVAAAAGASFLILGGGILLVLPSLPLLATGFHAVTGAMMGTTAAAKVLRGVLLTIPVITAAAGVAMIATGADAIILKESVAALSNSMVVLSSQSNALTEKHIDQANAVIVLHLKNEGLLDSEWELQKAFLETRLSESQLALVDWTLIKSRIDLTKTTEESTDAFSQLQDQISELMGDMENLSAEELHIERIMSETNEAIRDQEIAAFYAANQKRGLAEVAGMLGVTEDELQASLARANQSIEEQGNLASSAASDLRDYVAAAEEAAEIAGMTVYQHEGGPTTLVPYSEIAAAAPAMQAAGISGWDAANLAVAFPGIEAMLPQFQYGGIVPGLIGQPQLVVAHGGEVISQSGMAGLRIEVPVYLDCERIAEVVIDNVGRELLKQRVRSEWTSR